MCSAISILFMAQASYPASVCSMVDLALKRPLPTMLKAAPIVILDEATAYTDPENEAVIQRSVSKLTAGKTLIVIAHRLSTVTDAERIYVVNNGNIEDSGTHEELLSHHGLYEKMWKAHMEVKDNG